MPLSDWATLNEDGSWTGVDGVVYPSLTKLFEQLVGQWKSTRLGLEQAEAEIAEMREELPFLGEKEAEKKELKKLDEELKEALQELVLLSPDKLHGTTKQTRNEADINEEAAIEWIILAEMPRSWLTLSKEGLNAIKKGVTDRMSEYAGRIPDEVAMWRAKPTAVLYSDELFNRNKKSEE
jgi:hypothetical protein